MKSRRLLLIFISLTLLFCVALTQDHVDLSDVKLTDAKEDSVVDNKTTGKKEKDLVSLFYFFLVFR